MSPELTPAQVEAAQVFSGLVTIGIFALVMYMFSKTRQDVYVLKLQEIRYALFNYMSQQHQSNEVVGYQKLHRFLQQLETNARDIGPLHLKIMQCLVPHNPTEHGLATTIESTACPDTRKYFQGAYNQVMDLTKSFVYHQRIWGWLMLPFAPKRDALCVMLTSIFETREKIDVLVRQTEKTLTIKADT